MARKKKAKQVDLEEAIANAKEPGTPEADPVIIASTDAAPKRKKLIAARTFRVDGILYQKGSDVPDSCRQYSHLGVVMEVKV